MKGSLAEELYSESLKLSKLELNSASSAQSKVMDSQGMMSFPFYVADYVFFPKNLNCLQCIECYSYGFSLVISFSIPI